MCKLIMTGIQSFVKENHIKDTYILCTDMYWFPNTFIE